jgi:hypothetical protein
MPKCYTGLSGLLAQHLFEAESYRYHILLFHFPPLILHHCHWSWNAMDPWSLFSHVLFSNRMATQLDAALPASLAAKSGPV